MSGDWNPRFLTFCRLHEVDPERIHSGDGTSPVKMVDFLDWVARMKRECASSTQGIIDSSRRVINQDAWTAWLDQYGQRLEK